MLHHPGRTRSKLGELLDDLDCHVPVHVRNRRHELDQLVLADVAEVRDVQILLDLVFCEQAIHHRHYLQCRFAN